MSDFITPSEDQEIIQQLRNGLASAEPVPSDVTEFAKAAFTWRDIDAELADLEFDSIEEDLPAGVRSSATARMVSFQAGQWMLDLEYDETSNTIMGHISPATSFTVELHLPGARFSVESDEHGRFEAHDVSTGPVSLVLRMTDGQVIKTRWIVL